jgi:DNA polymerase-3 subunit alpha
VLKKYSEGIIALTACIAGHVPNLILRDDMEGAERILLTLLDIYGKEDLYVEIQDHGLDEEKKSKEGLLRLAKKHGLKLVATNDAHYITRKTRSTMILFFACRRRRRRTTPKECASER